MLEMLIFFACLFRGTGNLKNIPLAGMKEFLNGSL